MFMCFANPPLRVCVPILVTTGHAKASYPAVVPQKDKVPFGLIPKTDARDDPQVDLGFATDLDREGQFVPSLFC
jgi:hypothetical protein